MPPFSLLALPAEIRHLIYRHYVSEAEGYHYDWDSGKMHTVGGEKVDLALMFTCKQAVQEILPTVFRTNTFHFSTSRDPSQSERTRAGRHHILQTEIMWAKMFAIRATNDADLSSCRSSEFDDHIRARYPQFKGCLLDLDAPPSLSEYRRAHLATYYEGMNRIFQGESPSAFRGYLDSILGELSRDPRFLKLLGVRTFEERDDLHIHRVKGLDSLADLKSNPYTKFFDDPAFLSTPPAWSIPSKQQVVKLQETMGFARIQFQMWMEIKWRFSAAAKAISFFETLPRRFRLEIRNVVLHEDSPSSSEAPSHGLGLIQFAKENPKLKIERRLNVWKGLGVDPMSRRMRWYLRLVNKGYTSLADLGPDVFPHKHIARFLSPWLLEALALPAAGMPDGSFSLTLDAEPFTAHATKLLETAKAEALWQAAWHERNAERSIVPKWHEESLASLHIGKGFPEALKAVVEGTPLVSCNFPTGSFSLDTHLLVTGNRHANDKMWKEGLSEHISQINEDVGWEEQSLAGTLAAFQLEPLLPFNGLRPSEVSNWTRRFESFQRGLGYYFATAAPQTT